MTQAMRQIINLSTDPYYNMALEEYALMHLPADQAYFLFWQNKPTVVIGRNQNTLEEINDTYLKGQGINLVRRLSGGGAVYHDFGNLNFTFIVEEKRDFTNFDKFTRPVISALGRLGVKAELSGRNDLTVTGKKFSGNAQFKHKGRLLHHGTLLFDADLETMVKALNPHPTKIALKGIKSVRSRVTNLREHFPSSVTLKEFQRILTEEVAGTKATHGIYQLSTSDQERISELREKKYTLWEWNYGVSPAYNVRKTATFSWGHFDCRFKTEQGIIQNCKIFGDFFCPKDLAELENRLVGIKYTELALKKRLEETGLHRFFPQSKEGELIALLTQPDHPF